MKKTTIMRIASTLLIAVLLTTCAIGATFAKYVTNITAGDEARVALFKVTAFGKTADTFETNESDMDLWTIGQVYDTYEADYANGVADEDIYQVGEYIIAPGSWGKFTYTIMNESEVDVTYEIEYTVDEAGVPLEWSIDGQNWTDNLANVGATEMAKLNGSTDVDVYWRWAFVGTDATTAEVKAAQTDSADTGLGFAGNVAPTIGIKVTFTQVN